jgi:glycosyltransferase involved in cell wall biosynthesis
MVDILAIHLVYVPDISNEAILAHVYKKIGRDFPWMLSEHGILVEEVNVYLFGAGQGWSGWRKKGNIACHAGFRATSLFFLDAALASITNFFSLIRLARNMPISVVIPAPEMGLGPALAKAFASNRIRLVVRVIGHAGSRALHAKRSWVLYKIIEAIERFVLRRADLVLPMGKFTKDLAISHGAKSLKVLTVPFSVPWANCAEITDLPEKPTVLFAGWLEKGKGVHVLLESISKVRENVANVHLLIAGDGIARPALEKTMWSLGLSDHVSFLGWLQASQLRKAYKASWVLVLPSIWEEGLDMVLVEAGLMGRPAVGSNLGGIRDIIHPGENGLLVPPADPKALTDALMTFLMDRDLTRRMGLANNRIAQEYLQSWKKATEATGKGFYALFRG